MLKEELERKTPVDNSAIQVKATDMKHSYGEDPTTWLSVMEEMEIETTYGERCD